MKEEPPFYRQQKKYTKNPIVVTVFCILNYLEATQYTWKIDIYGTRTTCLRRYLLLTTLHILDSLHLTTGH